MECKTSTSNKQISYEGDDEDGVVIILDTIHDPSSRQIHEKKVGECVDYFCSIRRRIVILSGFSSWSVVLDMSKDSPLHTNQLSMYVEANIPRQVLGMGQREAMIAWTWP